MEETKLAAPDTGVKPEEAPEFDTLDYVKELFLHAERQEKRDKKKLGLLRLNAIFLAVVMVTLILTVVLAGPYVKTAVTDFHAISEKVQEINVQKLTADVEGFLGSADASLAAVGDAASKLAKIDIATLNGAIAALTKTVENFGKIDIAKLNESIDMLAKVADALANIKFLGKPLLG